LYFQYGACTCFVLSIWCVYMFCTLNMVRVHVLYFEYGACTCFVLSIWYFYIFSIMTAVRVHVLYCNSCKLTCFVLWQRYARTKDWKAVVKRLEGTRLRKEVLHSETVNGGGRGDKISCTSSLCFNAHVIIHPSLLRLFVLRPLPI